MNKIIKKIKPAITGLVLGSTIAGCTTSHITFEDLKTKLSEEERRYVESPTSNRLPINPADSITIMPYEEARRVAETYSHIAPTNVQVYLVEGNDVKQFRIDTRGTLNDQVSKIKTLEGLMEGDHGMDLVIGTPSQDFTLARSGNHHQFNTNNQMLGISTIGEEYNKNISVVCNEVTHIENGNNTSNFHFAVDFKAENLDLKKGIDRDNVFMAESGEAVGGGFLIGTAIGGPEVGVIVGILGGVNKGIEGLWAYAEGDRVPETMRLISYQPPRGKDSKVFNTHRAIENSQGSESLIVRQTTEGTNIVYVASPVYNLRTDGDTLLFETERTFGRHLNNLIYGAVQQVPAGLLYKFGNEGSNQNGDNPNPPTPTRPGRPSGGVGGGSSGSPGGVPASGGISGGSSGAPSGVPR